MKRIFAKLTALAASAVMSFSMVSCGNGAVPSDDAAPTGGSDKLHVICTTFSEYDWTRTIAGSSDKVEITYLLDNGVDLHNYQPSAEDIMKISDCDMFIYVGGESDMWVHDALKETRNSNMQVIKLLDVLGDSAKEEEIKEGMQAEDEEGEEDGEEEGPE